MMKDIALHTDSDTSVTCVPNAFIDHFMADANGEYVKIYLYLLRCINSGSSFSVSDIADTLEHTEKDILRAFSYWEKLKLLRLEYDNEQDLSGICLLDIETAAPQNPAAEMLPVPPQASLQAFSAPQPHGISETGSAAITDTVRPEYTKEQISSFHQNEDIQDLMFISEKYIGHPLNPTDVNRILYWYDGLHFSIDLIEYLIEYCVDKGHPTTLYMDKIAFSWDSAGISTVEQAKEDSVLHSRIYTGILKAFGIRGRNLVPAELKYIDTWTKDYGFSIDIIEEACRRTILSTSQPSFGYADKILTEWKKKNVQTLNDITLLDSAHREQKNTASKSGSYFQTTAKSASVKKNRFTNYPQRSYDYSKLERQLLNHSMQ